MAGWEDFPLDRQGPNDWSQFPVDMPGTTAPPEAKPWAERAADTAAYYEKLLRLGTNAATFGMADRFAAGGEALTGGAPSYAEALKKERDISETIARENPQMAVAAEVIGGATGGAGLARAGLTTAGRMAGQPLWRRSVAAGLEGAAQGGAQGAGQTYTGNPMDYVSNAGKGAVLGGVLGLPAPAVGAVGGAAWKGIDSRFGIPPPLARAAQTDAAELATLQNRGARAMLPDAGPSMQGVAQGAVIGGEGPGRAALIANLTERNRTVPQTITREVDQTFGPAETPSVVEEGVRGRMRAIGPEYDTLLNGPNVRAIDNTALAQRLEALAINERGQTQQVLRQVRGMLDIPTNPGVLDPHPRALHATREEVRGMMNDPNLNDTARGRLRQIYTELTGEIQRKVPGIRELDSRYAELGTQEAASTTASPGARMFEKGREAVTRPDELQRELTEAAQPKGVNIGPSAEPVRIRQAARAELDRIVGTNKNDLLALENLLGRPQDWNAQKLGIMFGRERADRLMNTLESERIFRDTYGKVVEGSQTAQRTASKEALDASSGKIPWDTSVLGTLGRGLQWAKDRATQASAAGTRDRISEILATNDPQQIRALIPQLLAAEPDRERRAAIAAIIAQSGWTGGGAGLVPSTVRK
jgi:hypothetical protein